MIEAGETAEYPLGRNRRAYLVPASGAVEIDGNRINTRDGAAIVVQHRVRQLSFSPIHPRRSALIPCRRHAPAVFAPVLPPPGRNDLLAGTHVRCVCPPPVEADPIASRSQARQARSFPAACARQASTTCSISPTPSI